MMRLFGRSRDRGRDPRVEQTAALEPVPAPEVENPPIDPSSSNRSTSSDRPRRS
jgi:hypothetical protein